MTQISALTTLFVLAALLASTGAASAQTPPAKPKPSPAQNAAPEGPPNALQGFSKNKDEPVQIEAATLDVRDKDKVATFRGNVHVIQGDTDLRTKVLVVYYEDADAQNSRKDNKDNKPGVAAAQPGPGGSSQIKRLEAIGDVFVTRKDPNDQSKEQRASGDRGDFDMKTNKIILTGRVLVSQGDSVLRGEKLTVDRTTGNSIMEAGKGGSGKVMAIIPRTPSPDGSTAPKLPGTN